jgi:hypothetical protein
MLPPVTPEEIAQPGWETRLGKGKHPPPAAIAIEPDPG